MAEGRRDKPFWYHKWVTVRRADFCSECGKARSKDGALPKCSRCKSVSYCNVECQRKHWNRGHKERFRCMNPALPVTVGADKGGSALFPLIAKAGKDIDEKILSYLSPEDLGKIK